MRIRICRDKLYKQDFSELSVIENSAKNQVDRNVLMDDVARVIALMIQED